MDCGGRNERTGDRVTSGNQVQGAAAQFSRGRGIAWAERVGGILEQPDRHLVARLGARGELHGDLDRDRPGGEQDIDGLPVERPAR